MFRTNAPDSTPDNRYQDGNPATGQEGTVVTAAALNAIQEEIANAVESAGLTLDEEDDTQLAQAVSTVAGARAGSRNLLANGDFRLWQRDTAGSSGTSIAVQAVAGEKYGADRWLFASDGSTAGAGGITGQRQAFAVGQVDVPGEPEYFLRWIQTTGATNGRPKLAQRIEDVRTGAGRSITVSLWLKASADLSADLVVEQAFGSGGSPTVTASRTVIDVGTAWQRHVVTVTLASIDGKTLGPAHFLELRVEGPTGAPFTLDVADVQVENGGQVSAFDRRAFELELAYCQRYYEKSWDVETPVATATDLGLCVGGQNAFDDVDKWRALSTRFRVVKRAVPTVVFWGNAGTSNRVVVFDATPTTQTVIGVRNASASSTGYPETADVPIANTILGGVHWTADAEL